MQPGSGVRQDPRQMRGEELAPRVGPEINVLDVAGVACGDVESEFARRRLGSHVQVCQGGRERLRIGGLIYI